MFASLLKSQFFYTTTPQSCPYLPDQTESKVITILEKSHAVYLHNRLTQIGFRRSHSIIYAPICSHCNACIPIRIPVAQFEPDSTQKRIYKYNRDLQVIKVNLAATEEQFLLFKKYLSIRHPDGEMLQMNFQEYKAMIEDSPIPTELYEFRLQNQELLAVSLIDQTGDGLSAVYTFYSPDYTKRSLGSFSILYFIKQTLQTGLAYLYLGYWVKNSAKMCYKAKFKPSEIFLGGRWQPLILPTDKKTIS